VSLFSRLHDQALMRALYLHGFASSPESSKAQYFKDRLAACGVAVEVPNFNEPAFESLTVTRMLAQVGEAIGQSREPVSLIGSSLGAFVAVNAAARFPVDRLVLLAPALDFATNRMRDLGPEGLARWRSTGTLDVFHYGFNRPMPLGFGIYEDAAQYDAFALHLRLPILIFQGTRDTVVDPVVVTRFAHDHPNVTLHLLDDDHQLRASLDRIWEQTCAFLALPGPADFTFDGR
jgi:pimeloyl-ACP methyl ester carboxylesterase